jgi:hypothetical protein
MPTTVAGEAPACPQRFATLKARGADPKRRREGHPLAAIALIRFEASEEAKAVGTVRVMARSSSGCAAECESRSGLHCGGIV